MRKIWMILAATMLMVAACGDDDSDVAADDTGTEDDGTADDPDAGGDGDDAGDDSGDDSGEFGDAAAFLSDENCNFWFGGSFLNPLAGLTPGSSPDSFDDVGDWWDHIGDDAPDEIRDEMQLVADRFEELYDRLGDIDFSDPNAFQDPEVQQVYAGLAEVFDDEYAAAAETVGDHFDENCNT